MIASIPLDCDVCNLGRNESALCERAHTECRFFLCLTASGVIFLGFLKALWVLCVTRLRHAATATPRFTDKQKITVGFLITDGAFKKRSVIAIKD